MAATIKNGVYRIGDVAFGIDEESLPSTVKRVARLPQVTLEGIILAHGMDVPADAAADAVLEMAQGLVQEDWYTILKGEVPMAVKKNQEKREKKLKEKKATPGGGRKLKNFSLLNSKEIQKKLESAKGQKSIVIECLRKLGVTDTAQLTKCVEESGQLTTKQDARRVVGFYVSQMKRDGFLKGAGPVAVEEEEAEA